MRAAGQAFADEIVCHNFHDFSHEMKIAVAFLFVFARGRGASDRKIMAKEDL